MLMTSPQLVGNYVCIVCGEFVAQRSLAVCTEEASFRTR